jgi:hypothetical protein
VSRKIADYPIRSTRSGPGGHRLYRWDEWLDGGTHVLEQGEDFDAAKDVRAMAKLVLRAASHRGGHGHVSWDRDFGTVRVAFCPEPNRTDCQAKTKPGA